LIETAKGQAGLPDRLGSRKPGLHVFFNLLLEVESQLLIQLAFHGHSPEESAKTIEKVG
jgi:hypothetical protein